VLKVAFVAVFSTRLIPTGKSTVQYRAGIGTGSAIRFGMCNSIKKIKINGNMG
jgi:hypothetical protein